MTAQSGIFIAALAGIMIFAAGCNSIPDNPPEFYENQNAELAKITSFGASGKIAIIEKQNRLSSYVNVSVKDDRYLLELTSLTGSTVFRLENSPGEARITDSEGKQYSGSSADDLARQLTGLSIPARRLPDIIRAIPGDLPFVRNADSTISEITHPEFTVIYERYTNTGKFILPEFITLKGKDLLIKIRINKWEI